MRTIPFPPRSRRLLHAALLAATGLALTACGSDDDTGASPEQSAAASDDTQSAYVTCIEEQGIDLPDDWAGSFGGGGEMPSFDPENRPSDRPTDMPRERPTSMPSGGFGGGGFEAPEGVSDDQWQAAQEACSSELPMGDRSFPGGEAPGESDDLAAYRNCLAERGVELGEDVAELDETDPDTAAAMEECAALAPEPDTVS